MARRRAGEKSRSVAELLAQFAGAEEAFLQQEFLAPVVPGGAVRVRIAGVICQVTVEPANFSGWGVFRPSSHTSAALTRAATLAERRRYLALLPQVRLIACQPQGAIWQAAAAHFGDTRVQVEALVPVQMAEEMQSFDMLRTRYDGTTFWFEEVDARSDPAMARYLREALAAATPPEQLARPGLTPELRAVYEARYWDTVGRPPSPAEPAKNPPHRRRSRRQENEQEVSRDFTFQRLLANLSHAGARLIEYLERGDSYRVTYSVDGQRYTSSVQKGDLSVQTAGICLSGEDQKFDLASLVGVLREGNGGLRIGDDGMDEETYWNIHPPRG